MDPSVCDLKDRRVIIGPLDLLCCPTVPHMTICTSVVTSANTNNLRIKGKGPSSPGIFGSQNVFLPVFPPTKTIIRRSFESILRVNSYMFSPRGLCLSAKDETKF